MEPKLEIVKTGTLVGFFNSIEEAAEVARLHRRRGAIAVCEPQAPHLLPVALLWATAGGGLDVPTSRVVEVFSDGLTDDDVDEIAEEHELGCYEDEGEAAFGREDC